MFYKRYRVNEVVAELDQSDFEDSEDDLDGYLDMKSDNEAYTNEKRDLPVEGEEERTEKEDVLIGNTERYGVITLLSSPLPFLPSTPFSLVVQLL